MATKAQQWLQEREEAKQTILELLGTSRTVYTCLRHVSKSGMSRHISVHCIGTRETGPNGEKEPYLFDLTYLVSKVASYGLNKDRDALLVGGCGMDMGFAVVYDLSGILFAETDPTTEPRTNATTPDHSDAGYVLSQRWI